MLCWSGFELYSCWVPLIYPIPSLNVTSRKWSPLITFYDFRDRRHVFIFRANLSGPPLSFFVNNVRSYCKRYTILGVDWPFASLFRRGLLWHREAGEKKREARKARWERERKKKGVFSFSSSSPTRLVYFDYCYFYWDTQREPLQRRATFCFLLTREEVETPSPSSFSWLYHRFIQTVIIGQQGDQLPFRFLSFKPNI